MKILRSISLACACSLPLAAGDAGLPADKGLSQERIRHLLERGTPEVYHGAELTKILMPIGGICTGQDVDLSGEGALTGWRVHQYPLRVAQGFALRTTAAGKTETRLLNKHDFPDMSFRGEYPIAQLAYADPALPVQVSLEAFSPFIPLDTDDSALPVTVFRFTLKNTSAALVEATLAGSLQNGICDYNRFCMAGSRHNQIVRSPGMSVLNCSVSPAPPPPKVRADITFEDWSKETYEGWTVEGTAFGPGPTDKTTLSKIFHNTIGQGEMRASSIRPPFSQAAEAALGKLVSAPFTIQRNYINVWLSGGANEGKTCVNLLVDGRVAQSFTGNGDNQLAIHCFDVQVLEGKQATLEIVDASTGDRGHITVGRIVFSYSSGDGTPLEQYPDAGTMALALLGPPATLGIAKGMIGFAGDASDEASVPLAEPLIGTLGRSLQLKPGGSDSVVFLVAWHFPNLEMDKLGKVGRRYARTFGSARAVVDHVAKNFTQLADTTRLWHDTWYDSTLPWWFLDRTFSTSSTLATSVCYRFADGRFYGYEGGPAPNYLGTCTHVWQYAHAVARLFPELERDTRERVDLGIARIPATGVIGFRAEYAMGLAVDGQAGTILRIYREHEMAPDAAFLKRNWANITTTFNPLFALDADEDGILDGCQVSTLDCGWFGQVAWMSGMYVAALRAGEQMATEIGDMAFAGKCRRIAESGSRNLVARLYNGEYFINVIDPKHAAEMNSGGGCFIDQVYGQSWAFQVGLPRILPKAETCSALRSLWTYNYSPDIGTYNASLKTGRRFVARGDAGMIMCSFPHPDWTYEQAAGGADSTAYSHQFAKYFNEVWTGQEYQVASHMLWEGMVPEGMAMVRAIHDRYQPLRRNPWAEEEAGRHYSRAMASYGAFIGACGFTYHGPKGRIGFAPRLSPACFRAAFTAAEGWGTYAQSIEQGTLKAAIAVKWGRLSLKTLALKALKPQPPSKIQINYAGKPLTAPVVVEGEDWVIQFPQALVLASGASLEVALSDDK